jgi:ribosome hibernation promoting factor
MIEDFAIKIYHNKTNFMNIIIKSADFKIGKGLETFVKEKVKKLFTQSDNIMRANVMLRKEASRNPKNKLCEIRLEVPGYDHFVKKSSEGYGKSVSQAVDVLQRILRRNKNRVLAARQSPALVQI